jgi:hypothetical protein
LGCVGKIDFSKSEFVPLQISFSGCGLAYPCDKCGLLHWDGGEVCLNQSGGSIYSKEGSLVKTEKQVVLVYKFPNKTALTRRIINDAVMLGVTDDAVKLHELTDIVGCFDPRGDMWISIEHAQKILTKP